MHELQETSIEKHQQVNREIATLKTLIQEKESTKNFGASQLKATILELEEAMERSNNEAMEKEKVLHNEIFKLQKKVQTFKDENDLFRKKTSEDAIKIEELKSKFSSTGSGNKEYTTSSLEQERLILDLKKKINSVLEENLILHSKIEEQILVYSIFFPFFLFFVF